MKQISNLTNDDLKNQALEFSRKIGGSADVIAIAQVDQYSKEIAKDRIVTEIMLVFEGFQPRVLSYIKMVNERPIFFFAVDRWIFERDIERGFLGEAVASKLIFPHSNLLGGEYLDKQEVVLKKRLILEVLENLIANFPELTNRMQIQPQYFLYEVMLNRVRIFPLLAYDASKVVNELTLNESESLLIYNEALRQLAAENKIFFLDDYVKITKKFIEQRQDPRVRILNLTKNAPRAVFSLFFGFLPQLMSIVSQNSETFFRTQKRSWIRSPDSAYLFLDPQKYVFVQTSEGLISLSDKIDIKGFTQKMVLKGQNEDVKVEPVGGMLNDVYLITAFANGVETKALVKRYKDWSGFKWFPLTLWSVGAKNLSISAQARLAKECAIGEALLSEGFNVPKILHVSNAERLVFLEYIDGENLSEFIRRIASAKKGESIERELAKLSEAGETLAKVHSHGITLGDTKPENMIVKPDGRIYMIDFEQATRGGDKSWDLAVFLYYSGHYFQPFTGSPKAEAITKAVIAGYLRGGGDANAIRKAGGQKYRRVFGIFTMWGIISAIANICRKTEDPK